MTYFESIEIGLKDSVPHHEIARKIYLAYPTHVLIGKEERQYEILNKISMFFKVPLTSIQVVGSAKTGYSFCRKSSFDTEISDLDIAIIDSRLFIEYSEWVFNITKGHTNLTAFDPGNFNHYKKNIVKGIFRPDLMPSGSKRKEWFGFFGGLSRNNKDLFKSINAGVYLSQTFFEYKQTYNIKEYINSKII